MGTNGKTGSTAYNRRLAQWWVKWLIEHSTSHQNLCLVDSEVLRNRHLRVAAKRYRHFKITATADNKQQKWNKKTS